MMDAVDYGMSAADAVVMAVMNAAFGEHLEAAQAFVEQAHHHDVQMSREDRVLVQGDSNFIRWYKMLSLYIIWGWISYACPISGWFFLFFTNDGGVFYNECYYMFYNGVVWYNRPEPYVVEPSCGLFGCGDE